MITIDKTKAQSIFILEDDDSRIEWFKNKFSYAPVVYITKQTGIALHILYSRKFDILFLDHDLCDENYNDYFEGREPQKETTGLYIVERLSDTLINRDTLCIVHSMNPIGANRMIQAHPTGHCFWIPFYTLKESLVFEENQSNEK